MQEVKLTRVPVGMLSTSCYVLWLEGRDDCIVVDPGDEPERIRRAMNGKRLAAILLTHGHFDHIGGVDGLMEEGTELLIHHADAPMLRDMQLNVSWMAGEPVICREATRTVEEGDVLQLAGMEIRVLHTPGHTAGGACYIVGSWLLTGDTMFEYGYGRTDLPTGSEAQLVQSLRRLMPMRQQYTVCGGHS